MTIRVLIADDQDLVRTGLRMILDAHPDVEVVGEAADGRQAVALAHQLRPDVCLFEIRMPVLDGIDATRQLAGPDVEDPLAIVVITTFDLDEYVLGALKAGARSFLLKDAGPDLLTQAIHAAANGDALIAPNVTARLLATFADTPTGAPPIRPIEPLTAREEEVLITVARGRTNSEIADERSSASAPSRPTSRPSCASSTRATAWRSPCGRTRQAGWPGRRPRPEPVGPFTPVGGSCLPARTPATAHSAVRSARMTSLEPGSRAMVDLADALDAVAPGRREPERTVNEPAAKADLHRYLQVGRDALLWKLEDLTEYQMRRPVVRTGTNLLGLVKHLAGVEAGYFGEAFDRPFPEPLPWMDEEAEPNADMWATADESSGQIVALYRRVLDHADATIEQHELGSFGVVPWWPADNNRVTLHRLLVHVATETHRHVGHADIVRELIDGAAGFRADNDNMAPVDDAWWASHRERLERVAEEAQEAT